MLERLSDYESREAVSRPLKLQEAAPIVPAGNGAPSDGGPARSGPEGVAACAGSVSRCQEVDRNPVSDAVAAKRARPTSSRLNCKRP